MQVLGCVRCFGNEKYKGKLLRNKLKYLHISIMHTYVTQLHTSLPAAYLHPSMHACTHAGLPTYIQANTCWQHLYV